MNKNTIRIYYIDGNNHYNESDINNDLNLVFGYPGFSLLNMDAFVDSFPYGQLICLFWVNSSKSKANCLDYFNQVIDALKYIDSQNLGFNLFFIDSFEQIRSMDVVFWNSLVIKTVQDIDQCFKRAFNIPVFKQIEEDDILTTACSDKNKFMVVVWDNYGELYTKYGESICLYDSIIQKVNCINSSIRFIVV